MPRSITKILLGVTCTCALSVASASRQCAGTDIGLNVRGTFITPQGAKFKGNRPTRISSGGTMINCSRKFYVGRPLTIERGGVLRNFGDATVGFHGSISGRGTIENAHQFRVDEALTERANEDAQLIEAAPDEVKVDEGGGFRLMEEDEYDYRLLTDYQLQEEAAYFDLVDAGTEAFYTPGDAIIRTPGGGQLPGTPRQEQIARRFVRARDVAFVDEAMLPSTTGEATSAEEFFAYDADAYDVDNQQIFLNVTGPTYIGASTYSEVGYVPQPEGVFVINGVECCLPPVNNSTVITQQRPGASRIRARGDVLKFEPWDPGRRGIDRYYQPPDSLREGYWVEPDDRTPDGDPVVIYGGDNSWFNGVYNLHHGGVVIDNGGAMFGGVINLGKVGDEREVDIPDEDEPVCVAYDAETLYQHINGPDEYERAAALAYARQTPEVELESQGGAKDEYNRPIVNMLGNATMYFNIPEDEDGNRIFSWYGDINGTPEDRIIFQQGEVYIKGDCSGFMGRVGVCDGAKFVIRSSDEGSSSRYVGTMFGGNVEIVDENGEADPNGVLTIDSTSGLRPVTFTNGTVNVVAEDIEVTDDVPRVDEITVKDQATVNMNYGNVELHDTSVVGPDATLNLNAGERAVLENFTLDKGTLNITGDDLAEVEINGDVRMGSAITAWTNNAIDNIPVNAGGALPGAPDPTWSLTDNVNLYFDFDPANDAADRFTSVIGVTSGVDHTFVLSGVKLLTQPTQDRHTFTILDFGNVGVNRYPEVVIDRNLVVVDGAVVNAVNGIQAVAGIYPSVTGSDGAPGATLPNGNYYFYGSNRAGIGQVMMVRGVLGYEYLEPVGLLVTSLRGTTSVDLNSFDEYGYVTRNPSGKYAIWNKTHAARYTISTEAGGAKTTRYGTTLGVDGNTTQLAGRHTQFIPTAYVAITRNNANLNSYKSGTNEYTGGAKAAWFDSVQAFEAQLTYSYAKFKTRNNPTLGLNAAAHTVSGVAKFGYNVTKIASVTVRPEMIAGYSWVHVSKSKSATDADIKLNKLHRISLIPGVNFIMCTDSLNVAASVRYIKQLGTKSKVVYGGETIKDIDKVGKGSVEMALNIEKTIGIAKLGLRASHSFGGTKGTKVTLNLGVNI
ncbi:MAG: autotransporter outer membrane beta-barrel domain-containing protein [Holosporales bacterium]|jgi:hypothetical protein|nr:autotransporter outer membrane beta-barrel domain-containing protein [Holosporales bacterium]